MRYQYPRLPNGNYGWYKSPKPIHPYSPQNPWMKYQAQPFGMPTYYPKGAVPSNTIKQPYPPYPNHYFPRPPMQSFFDNFKDENGKVDVQKVMDTFHQVSNTAKQISPLIKSFGPLFNPKG